jgi:hypothetical protein
MGNCFSFPDPNTPLDHPASRPSRREDFLQKVTSRKVRRFDPSPDRKGSDTRDFAVDGSGISPRSIGWSSGGAIRRDGGNGIEERGLGDMRGDMEERKESASTIPGLTFDWKGRPVWRGGFGSPIQREESLGRFRVG